MGEFEFQCPECRGKIAVTRNELGLELACPHCAKVVPVPWEEIAAEAPNRASIAESPTPIPSLISNVVKSEFTFPASVQQDSPTLIPDAILQLPELKDESLRSIQVRSSDGQRFYTVNLLDYTCTCSSFSEVHAKAPRRDVGRLCKHVCASLNRPKILMLLNPICLAMVQEGFGIYPGRVERDDNGNPIYITGVNTQGWINVFALKRRNGKTYYRFGYNPTEGRWAYGQKPKISVETPHPSRSRESSPTSWRNAPENSQGQAALTGIGRIILFLTEGIIYIFVSILAGFLASGTKSRRRKRW